MNNLKMISFMILAGTAFSSFAVAPVPQYADPIGRHVARYQTLAVPQALLAAAAKEEAAGFQSQPWSVERSAYFVRDTQVAEAGNDGDRGRL
ncbi:MAG: hypothetical protein Q8N51_04760 [Gammaproteobacteria bacterium]|nr:hypothetical protein [Gammaproteobacteria bacterium]